MTIHRPIMFSFGVSALLYAIVFAIAWWTAKLDAFLVAVAVMNIADAGIYRIAHSMMPLDRELIE